MSNPNRLFRQAALDRLSSPDQLDRAIVITDPRGWIVAATLGALLTALVVWGFAGSLPTNVPGKGILISQGGRVVAAMSPAAGQIDALLVRLGDTVAEGQPIARVAQLDVRTKLDNARILASEQTAERDRIRRGHDREQGLLAANQAQQRKALEQSIAASAEQAEWLATRLHDTANLVRQGIMPRTQVQSIQTDLAKARQQQADSRVSLAKLKAEENDMALRHARELADAEAKLSTTQRDIRELETRLERDTQVLAPAAGRVTELRAPTGTVVASGAVVAGIETAGATLEAVAYIPTKHGKMLVPGMTVRIAPDNVRREEFGTLQGVVRSVSAFPSSRESMVAVLQNDALATEFSKDGAPYEARIELLPGDTASGYAWSSRQGPPLRLVSGTTLTVDITVRQQKPAALIVPLLRKATGLDG